MHAPRRRRRALTAGLATAGMALATALVTAAGPVPTAQAAEGDPLRYVALGDSYSAGSGILPLDPGARPLCLRTTLNYPNAVADRLGADLTDVTCGGAQTKHFAESQYPRVPAQFDALTEDTDLVTLTIGGNDNSTFIGALLACGSIGALTAGHGNPCERAYGDRFTDQVEDSTYPALVAALQGIQERSPDADVAIVGYPWIVPETRGCFARMPIARGDIPYLRDLQSTLNGVIERAAAETGVTYVDLAEVSDGHDACAARGERWIEPLLFGTNVVPVHPNARGESAMADAALAALGY
ncbi:SGNH/GDSL hydrolase family protein [Isoptericola sp. NEAU-Y5]|uniref:SGNH/GDSL hydrolase family protein n=1 Tax=Isoptericola luteus TaxID=2879484 RepID=A0ABS7ZHL1_9MICO|nr:SGNH/GDSL hydrolase family protein [Isoptericola sp. NEAU-Y5]MCA5893300.1 SGNH/GDSL hydrolase family protein [Isoptericola sp. NEAU-Y5]